MLPENSNQLYTKEAISSISLTREVADKINELVDAYNTLAKDDLLWKHEEEGRIRKGILYMKDNLVNSLEDLLDTLKREGFIDERIKDYMEELNRQADELTSRLDAIISEVTTDSEVIDIRVDVAGKTHPTAGSQVRRIETLLNGVLSNKFDVYQSLSWASTKAINTNGNVYIAGSENFKVASLPLPKGAKVSYRLYSNSLLPVLAIGDSTKPVTIIKTVPSGWDSTMGVTGNYEVVNEAEVLWFSTTKLQDDNAYIFVTLPTGKALGWEKAYISHDGSLIIDNVYGVTEPIFVPRGTRISAVLMASDSVSAITKCEESGAIISTLRRGKNGALAQEYFYCATEDCYVRFSTRINGSGDTLSISNLNIKKEAIPKYYTPTFNIGNGHINVTDEDVRNDSVHMYSDLIYLDKGMTIRFFSSGSASMYCLSEWNDNREFVEGLVYGNSRHREITYTAPKDMIVRISAKKVQSGSEAVTTEEEFLDVKIYDKEIYYSDVKNSPLYGKSITFMGDSLAYGNILGADAVWLHLLALKYNMKETNMGINGNTVAKQNTETTNAPMVERYVNIPDSDYIVIIGGANDFRLNVAINDFKTALRTIIDGVRRQHSKAKILFLTNYNRNGGINTFNGLSEKNYVDAMIEVCGDKGVKCFDNYRESGTLFYTPNANIPYPEWFDEGYALGISPNRHISREGYEWLLPVYENILRGL